MPPDTETNLKRACVYVEKGGVAKTTSTAHLGVAAAQDHDLDVLLIDLAGTQNDLATHFGLQEEYDFGATNDGEENDIDAPISAVFGSDWEFIAENIPDIIERMTFPTGEGPDLIPSDPGIGGADNKLANEPLEDRYAKLDAFLTEHVAPEYDLVLLDLPGKEDNIALNGLLAAEDVVAPLKAGEFERQQLRNLEASLAEITADLEEEYDTHPQLALLFATMVDHRTNLATEFVEELEAAHPDTVGEPVPVSQNIGNEQAAGRTLFALADDELYSTGQDAREAYRTNTDLLLQRL